MTQKKQTAVQALIKALENDGLELFGMDEFLELEKQQIMQAAYDNMGNNFDPNMGRAEQYYNETFKQD